MGDLFEIFAGTTIARAQFRLTFRQTAVVFGDPDLTSLHVSLFKDTKNH
jgi:hypothetical protein